MKNSKDFAKEVREVKLDPDEELRSYAMSAVFTCVLMNNALDVIRDIFVGGR